MDSIRKGLREIEHVLEIGLSNMSSYQIDLSELTKCFENLSPFLKEKTNSCLYWFETDNNADADILVNLLDEKRDELRGDRLVPPRNKNKNSNIIYLGVRQGGKPRRKDGATKIDGRIFQHFGLYSFGSTQGLQLLHWASNQNIKLTLNIIEITVNDVQYLYIAEKLFSIKLNPLLGKH